MRPSTTPRDGSPPGRFAKALGLLFTTLVCSAVLMMQPADAQSLCDGSETPWVDEAEMISYDCPARNDIYDPGVNDFLTDQELTSQKSVDFYDDDGFSEQWLWYAPRGPQTFTSDSTLWGYCIISQRTEEGEICGVDNNGTVGFAALQTSFDNDNDGISNYDEAGSQPVTLSTLSYGGGFIARGCGNHSAVEPTSDPVPKVTGFKYHDLNRDGDHDSGEPGLGGWVFDLVLVESFVGQDEGPTGYSTTSAWGGAISFDFTPNRDLGPGRYRFVEQPQNGWTAIGGSAMNFTVSFGAGDSTINAGDIGNARTEADVAKVEFEAAADFPAVLVVRTPVVVPIDLVLRNNGPAERVRVRDIVTANGPDDCVFDDADEVLDVTLIKGVARTFRVEFTVTCERPSFHEFEFHDTLTVTEPGVTDPNLSNNSRTTSQTRPVHAFTDLSSATTLTCPDMTEVGVAISCAISVDVSNGGYGPVDVDIVVDLAQTVGREDDCTIEPSTLLFPAVEVGETSSTPVGENVTVTCGYRSDHQITAQTEIAAVDEHVFDTEPSNDGSGDTADFEVFHDAALTADDIALLCNETLGVAQFDCSATITVSNSGPAPDVNTTVEASIAGLPDCAAAPSIAQTTDVLLEIGVPQSVTFTWDLSCSDGAMLHPFRFTADVAPAADEPHAVDEPGPIIDDWTVPYCMETINPSGNNVPSAPGNGGQGQNQDGFYTFGAKTIDGDADVWIEDDGTGTVWGPFESGVEIKYTEANGAEPSIQFMGGNNGNGNGNGNGGESVDYKVKGQGDAVAVHYDEDGNVIRTTCLVPPFPQ